MGDSKTMATSRNATPSSCVTAERWQQVKDLLVRALEVEPSERDSFLQQACGEDSSLRSEIDGLLAADSDGELLQPAAILNHEAIYNEHTRAHIGRHIGPYQIVEEIGCGGMGEVYRAFRADDQYRKEVAIKLVRAGQDSKFVITRFKLERQVLADLDHPNIARLLDGGTTEEGIPYFVMELIRGQLLTEYCDRQKLPTTERLRLFLPVCSAVQYAHQRLIIHRDLKPNNILVTAEGIPKLLDFGIAKIIDPADSPQVADGTLSMFRLLTPAYASPEQVRGENITTASDVYSLGVLLYECLTGHRPYGAGANGTHEMEKAVCESEPQKPSTVVRSTERQTGDSSMEITPASVSIVRDGTPEKLEKRLRGDLDNIVLMALRKEPERRYASVEQFAIDVGRHLEYLPVIASKDTVRYRTAKFIARHRTGVVAAVALLLVVLAGAAATLYEAHRARQNELRAERRFNDVRKLANSLLFDIHDSVKDLPGSTPARKLIIQNALQYLDSLSSEAGGDPSLQRELATAYERVGEVQGHFLLSNLGETENALHSFEKALRLRKTLASSAGFSWQDKLALARCHRLVATQLQAVGKVHDALENIRTAIPLAESLRKEHPQEIGVLGELSQDYGINAYLHRGGGVFPGLLDPAEEAESRRKAIAVDEDWLTIAPSSEEAQHALAWDQVNYAERLGEGKKDEALRYFLHSLEIEKQIRARADSPERAREVVSVYNRLGMFYDRINDIPDSLKSHRSALKIEEEFVSEDPHNQHFVENLAVDHANIAECLSKMGQVKESKLEIAKAMVVMEGLMRDSPGNVSYQIMLSEMHVLRAQILRRSSDPAASLHDYKIALDGYRNLFDKGNGNEGPHLSGARCSMGMAKAELQLHRPGEASASFRAALDSLKPLVSSDKPDSRILYLAAYAYAGLGRIEAAQAGHLAITDARSHWEAARNWFRMSLEELTHIPQATFHIDDNFDVGPLDIAQIKKELSRCEAALQNSMSDGSAGANSMLPPFDPVAFSAK
jgi:eukaryotic-like serine/threonine-protein kinase